MKEAIILLNEKESSLATYPIIDNTLLGMMVDTLNKALVNNIAIVGSGLKDIKGAKVYEELNEAIKSFDINKSEVIIFDHIYPNIDQYTIENLYSNAYSRLGDTKTLKLHIKDLVNIKKINFVKVLVKDEELKVINDVNEAYEYAKCLQQAIILKHSNNNVYFTNRDNVVVGKDVMIDAGVVIEGNVQLLHNTTILEGSKIGSGSILDNASIGKNTSVLSSRVTDSSLGNNVTLGPNSHLRMHSEALDDTRIGNFVEFKNVKFGKGSKCAHLTYLGDASVGENVNIGCGVVTVNYDGKNKFRTTIGNNAFIGSNANLIAPITVGDYTVVAAGSTITDNVEEKAMAIARARQTNKPEYGYKYIVKEEA